MARLIRFLIWTLVAALGAWAYLILAFRHGEPINSAYILIAALCSYAIGYRFYSKWIAAKVLALNDRRATPSEVHDDGKDFVKTNKWIVFGHHFAAISGPGPLVGPVLAAQFGYLPGTLWILIGVVLGGAVQDFVILFSSLRRNGKSLGQMVKDELNTTAGYIALIAVLAIMIILLAVLGLVVVQALAHSPWGVFTVGATIPIAMFMGSYMRFFRVGKVLEISVIGVVLLLLAVWGGQFIHGHKALAEVFKMESLSLAKCLVLYGLAASILPVWLLLAPRDYLSTFMKLGTILALAIGVLAVLPTLKMPAITKFVDGSGLVVAGKLFPFCFITIACGAISGFHTLVSSGTTPKIIARERHARSVGYGAMLLESLVAIMAMIAACTLDPGVYLSMNVKGVGPTAEVRAADIVQKVNAVGPEFAITVEQMNGLATQVQEETLFGRTGGAATLAVGMAQIFSKAFGDRWLHLWYHFAIMFEALFILTTLDAGTRVGRYLVQDFLGHLWKPLGETKNFSANLLASVLVVAGWGYFLIQGVKDPLGGINSLWPLFGIANQLLAAIALCLATTIILKMHLADPTTQPRLTPQRQRPAWALVTLVPLAVLLVVTLTAGYQKIFHEENRTGFPKIGFLQLARMFQEKQPALDSALEAARQGGITAEIKAAEKAARENKMLRFNNLLDAVVAGTFMVLVVMIVLLSFREWILLLARKRLSQLQESPPVWLEDYQMASEKPLHFLAYLSLLLALARELTDEAAWERAQKQTCACSENVQIDLLGGGRIHCTEPPGQKFAAVTKARWEGGVKRCC